jgi:hypothetical protein
VKWVWRYGSKLGIPIIEICGPPGQWLDPYPHIVICNLPGRAIELSTGPQMCIKEYVYNTGWWFGTFLIFPILRISKSQLTFIFIFFRGVETSN